MFSLFPSAFALSISFHDNSTFLIGMNVLKNFKTIDEIIARNIFPDRFANLSNSKEPFSTGFPILRKLVIGATSWIIYRERGRCCFVGNADEEDRVTAGSLDRFRASFFHGWNAWQVYLSAILDYYELRVGFPVWYLPIVFPMPILRDANELCFKTKFCQEVSVNFWFLEMELIIMFNDIRKWIFSILLNCWNFYSTIINYDNK